MACRIDSLVPTPSMTECAPSPPVSSLTRATPASPRSLTISVAPYSTASCWRGAWRLMAMICSAPSWLAASTASSPTAPSPTTATVLAGPASAATAANQPVPSTSEAASRLGISSAAGSSGGGDQGAVGQRDPQQLGLGTQGAHGHPLDTGALVAGPAELAAVVGGPERADPNWPGRMFWTWRPTSWTTPTYSWPIGEGPWTASTPR